MKKIVHALIMGGLVASVAQAAVLVSEDFNGMTAGADLTTAGWENDNGLLMQAVDQGGGDLAVATTVANSWHAYTVPLGTTLTGGWVWMTATVEAGGASQAVALSEVPNDAWADQNVIFSAGANGSAWQIRPGGDWGKSVNGPAYSAPDTIVGAIDLDNGTAYLWVNPGQEGYLGSADAVLTHSYLEGPMNYLLLNSKGDGATYDDVIIGTEAADVGFTILEPDISNALADLKDHIEGTITLTAQEIEGHKLMIDGFSDYIGSDDINIAAAFDLVEAYDSEVGPLWVDGSPIQKFLRSDTRDDDMDWLVFTVMQYIMDYAYTAENIARYETLLDGYKFGSSAHFPGAVAPPTDPNVPYTVSISGSYLDSFGDDLFHADRAARKPTGAYLAPGSIATVTVPLSLVGKGYQVRVGAHYWDFSTRPWILRLDRVSLLYDIDSTEIKVANPLGGGIYIDVPYLADAGTVSVTIKNAVRSPYYSAKSFHTTTLAEWQNIERHHPAPWMDIQTEKFMLQLPTDWIYALDDPQSLVEDWDAACDAMNDLMGHPLIHGKESYYAQADLQLRADAYSPGYPTVNTTYRPNEDYGGDYTHGLINNPRNAHNVVFHEQGHGYMFPKFSGEEESTVNLLHVAVWNRKYGYSMDEAFRSSRGFNDNEYRTLETTAMCWMMCENFMLEQPMEYHELIYQLKGHAKYVDMARLFGWDMLGDYWYSMNEDYENGNARPSGTDALILRMCETAGVDLRPLLQFWGIQPDNPATLAAAIAAANLSVSADIYNTLVRYKSLIPANNTEFQAFAYAWYEKVPDINSTYFVPMTEQYHASIWGTYDAAYAATIEQNVQHIIDLYFGFSVIHDVPASWLLSYSIDATDAGALADTDGDGLLNWEEYAAGSNPLVDESLPNPDPMTWTTPPNTASSSSISMAATDVDGLDYYFENMTVADGSHDSGWQDSASYTDRGLTPETTYTYTVMARDSVVNTNGTHASSAESATTFAVLGSENILLNGGFELDAAGAEMPTDWSIVGAADQVKDASGGLDGLAPQEGTTMFQLQDVNGALKESGVRQTFTVTTPGNYEMSGWFAPRNHAFGSTNYTFTLTDSSSALVVADTSSDPTLTLGVWNEITRTYNNLAAGTYTVAFVNIGTASLVQGTVDTFSFAGAGTLPPESIGKIDFEILSGSSEMGFSWYGEAGQSYGLEWTDNLVTGIWQTVTNISGADELISLTDEMDKTNAFYRVYLGE